VSGFRDRFKFPLELLGFAYQFVKAKLGAQLNSGQQLEYAVVQLSGDTPPLFLNSCRGNRALKAGPAIPFVFQVYLKSLLGPKDQSVDYSTNHCPCSALPKTHNMRKIPHLERLFPRIAKVAGFTKRLSLSNRLLDKQAFHRRCRFH